MDPIMIEKLQAMKRYHMYNKKRELLQSLYQYSLTTLFFGLFLSSPIWISSIKKLGSIVFEPKCLFILCNIIIAVLVGESKLSKSSPPSDIYDEYIERNKSLGRLSAGEEEEDGGSEDLDELNKRVEDFIAKVNKQRRVEARMVGC